MLVKKGDRPQNSEEESPQRHKDTKEDKRTGAVNTAVVSSGFLSFVAFYLGIRDGAYRVRMTLASLRSDWVRASMKYAPAGNRRPWSSRPSHEAIREAGSRRTIRPDLS